MKYNYKAILQADKNKDGFFALTIYRKVSRRLAYFFVNYMKIYNPNFVTLFSLVIGASFLVCSISNYPLIVKLFLLSLLYIFYFVVDCTDGIIARLTKNASKFGEKFDAFVDGRVEDMLFLSLFIVLNNILIIVLWILRKIDKIIIGKKNDSIYKIVFNKLFRIFYRNTDFHIYTPDIEVTVFFVITIASFILNNPYLIIFGWALYVLISFAGNLLLFSSRAFGPIRIFIDKFKLLFIGLAWAVLLALIILRNYLFSPGFVPFPECVGGQPFIQCKVSFSWDPLSQAANRLDTYIISIMILLFGARVSYFILLSIMGVVAYFVAISFVKKIISNDFYVCITGLITSTAYLMNPITSNEILRIGFIWSMTFLPLLYYMAFLTFSEITVFTSRKFIRNSIILALILFLIVGPHWELFSTLVFVFCLIANIRRPLGKYLFRSLTLTVSSFVIQTLLSFYWILPYLEQTFSGVIPYPKYVVSIEIVNLLSQHCSFLNVLRGMWYWGPLPAQFVFNSPMKELYIIATTLVPVLVFSSAILHRDRTVLTLSIFTIILLLFSSGSYYNYSAELYYWLIFKTPLSPAFGWVLRNPGRWMMVVFFCYSLLLSFSLSSLLKKIKANVNINLKWKKLLLLFVTGFFATSIIIAGFPLIRNSEKMPTSTFNGMPPYYSDYRREAPMTSWRLPRDYIEINQWLESDPEYYKLLTVPEAPYWGFPKPTLKPDSFLIFIIKENRSNELSELMGIRNVKYVFLGTTNYGCELEEEQSQKLLSVLEEQKDIKFYRKIGNIYVFENNNWKNNVYIAQRTLLLYGSMSQLNSLCKLTFPNLDRLSTVFMCQQLLIKNIPLYGNVIIDYNSTVILILPQLENYVMISPFEVAIHHNPSIVLWQRISFHLGNLKIERKSKPKQQRLDKPMDLQFNQRPKSMEKLYSRKSTRRIIHPNSRR